MKQSKKGDWAIAGLAIIVPQFAYFFPVFHLLCPRTSCIMNLEGRI